MASLGVEGQCSVCSQALGYGTPLPACSGRSATEQNEAGAQKNLLPTFISKGSRHCL